ncbi:NfeD family protein [Cohnella caldifontis]|uniref:NfeD family protein n=1 Tax=Cohnella caldifontis TaxID=3027471 RepID=UPI0023EC4225|nr:NfeD family protein [Cohnella sp. YIM B05605]
MLESWAIWFIIGVILLIAEMLTLTFYLLWLGIGAIAAGVIALALPGSFTAQGITCAVIALLLTLFTKRLTRVIRVSKGYHDPIDELIGKHGIVEEDVGEGKPGIVKVGGETWTAVSKQNLRKGEAVVVVDRGTTTLEVEKRGG